MTAIFKCLLLLIIYFSFSPDAFSLENRLTLGAERMDRLLPVLKNKRVAVVINQTSILGKNKVLLVDTLLKLNVDVKKIFVPEHGLRGQFDAGAKVNDSKDDQTGLPVISLYGKNRKPSGSQLNDIDVVVYDLQDVGVRFYTYISTMGEIMSACAEAGKEFVVCDRPDPNDYIDGPVLEKNCESFVGMYPIPVVYGLTPGELAGMIKGENWSGSGKCKLTVIEMLGWKHGDIYSLPQKPSPNLPDSQAVKLYPSLCLFEATDISVGRGTPFPFKVLGGPDKKYGTFSFTPVSLAGSDKNPLNKNIVCYGLDLRRKYVGRKFDLSYFLSFYRKSNLGGKFFSRQRWFDLLAGNEFLREQITSGLTENEIRKTWTKQLNEYKNLRSHYLLYRDDTE